MNLNQRHLQYMSCTILLTETVIETAVLVFLPRYYRRSCGDCRPRPHQHSDCGEECTDGRIASAPDRGCGGHHAAGQLFFATVIGVCV